MQAVLGLAATAGTHLAPTTNAIPAPALHINNAAVPNSGLLFPPTFPSHSSIMTKVPDYATSEAGNPFISGWYADPDVGYYESEYWIYPTSSLPYSEQTYLDAFSSPDLVHWTKHPRILTTESITWANRAVWAPSPVYRNGKYYLYFAANDIQVDEIKDGKVGGIGVAVADHPGGPFRDAIGKPLIGDFHNGAQPIDQDVFIDRKGSDGRGDEPGSAGSDGDNDDDGAQAYMYYGGHGHANVVKLNADMISLGAFSDPDSDTNSTTTTSQPEIYREITPPDYTEGSQMFTRKGVYYYMWSSGDWTGPSYSVSYAMSRTSPTGPFTLPPNTTSRILDQDTAVARGSGHNGVIHVPGTDIWYIVYHRRPLSETDGNHRVVCYDRMYFDDDNEGAIMPVQMLVRDNFADGDMVAWKTFRAAELGDVARPDAPAAATRGDGEAEAEQGKGAGWQVIDHALVGSNTAAAGAATFALLDTNFTDFIMDAAVSFPRLHNPDDDDDWMAYLIFHADGNAKEGYKSYSWAGFRPVLSKNKEEDTPITGTTTITSETDAASVKIEMQLGSSSQNGTRTVHAGSIFSLALATNTNTAATATTTAHEEDMSLDFTVRLVSIGGEQSLYITARGAHHNDAAGNPTGREEEKEEEGGEGKTERSLVLKATTGSFVRSGANGFAVSGTIEGIRFGHVSVKHAPPGMMV